MHVQSFKSALTCSPQALQAIELNFLIIKKEAKADTTIEIKAAILLNL